MDDCFDAISAFREISGLRTVASATPEDCERFQARALQLPKNWRQPGASPAEE